MGNRNTKSVFLYIINGRGKDMKKGNKLLLTIFIGIIISSIIIDIVFQNISDNFVWIITTIAVLFYVIFIVYGVRKIIKMNKEDNKIYKRVDALIQQKDFDEARLIIKDSILKGNFSITSVKIEKLLLILELTVGNNSEAKKIIETTKWGRFESEKFYFKVLFLLKEGRKDEALEYYKKLIKWNKRYKKVYQKQIDNLQVIFRYINEGVKENIETQFPLVKEIMNL